MAHSRPCRSRARILRSAVRGQAACVAAAAKSAASPATVADADAASSRALRPSEEPPLRLVALLLLSHGQAREQPPRASVYDCMRTPRYLPGGGERVPGEALEDAEEERVGKRLKNNSDISRPSRRSWRSSAKGTCIDKSALRSARREFELPRPPLSPAAPARHRLAELIPRTSLLIRRVTLFHPLILSAPVLRY